MTKPSTPPSPCLRTIVTLYYAVLAMMCLATATHSAPDGFVKIWEDTFDGISLNTENWTIGLRDSVTGDLLPGASGNYLLNRKYQGYITSEDVVVSNGSLKLLNQKRAYTGNSPWGNFDYTSGWVMSMHKVFTNKGYLEWRAKFPTGDKVWPALWLISEDLVWGPEWDCFEYFGYKGNVGYDVMGLHLLRDEWPNEKWSSYWLEDYDLNYDAGAWHVYGFEWTESYAKWYIDGVEVHYLTNTFSTSWPNEDMYIVMNNGVKDSSPDTNTIWPNELEIDYVALYRFSFREDPIDLVNHSFEADGAGKQPGRLPTGWSTDAPTGEGFEPTGATDGINAALLNQAPNSAGSNSNFGYKLYQTSSHLLTLDEVILLTFDTARTWTTTSDPGRTRATIFYEDGGARNTLATIAIDLPNYNPALDLTLDYLVTEPNAVGKPLGIEFHSESWGSTWVTVDNIRLASVVPGVPSIPLDIWMDGNDVKVEATNLCPGIPYRLLRDSDLLSAPEFESLVETKTPTNNTEVWTDPDALTHTNRMFYRL